jgi:hypothetical protein
MTDTLTRRRITIAALRPKREAEERRAQERA